MALCKVVRTAVKRHCPQHMCPHGVSVAFVGGQKQIGHMYVDRGSPVYLGGVAAFGFGLGAGGEEVSSTGLESSSSFLRGFLSNHITMVPRVDQRQGVDRANLLKTRFVCDIFRSVPIELSDLSGHLNFSL